MKKFNFKYYVVFIDYLMRIIDFFVGEIDVDEYVVVRLDELDCATLFSYLEVS